jgi:hypothetical protein
MKYEKPEVVFVTDAFKSIQHTGKPVGMYNDEPITEFALTPAYEADE